LPPDASAIGAGAVSGPSPEVEAVSIEALRRQYEPLLAYAGHRSDVNYIIGEMIAELNNSHAYVAGGDQRAWRRQQGKCAGDRAGDRSDQGRNSHDSLEQK